MPSLLISFLCPEEVPAEINALAAASRAEKKLAETEVVLLIYLCLSVIRLFYSMPIRHNSDFLVLVS